MKFTITMKDPDGVYDSTVDAVEQSLAPMQESLSHAEYKALLEARQEETFELLKKWFQYKEYVDLEVDTEAKTVTVLPVK